MSFMSFLSVFIFQTAVDADDISMVEFNVTEYNATPTVRIIILIFGMGLTNWDNKN